MTPAMLANKCMGGGMSVMHQVSRNLKKEEHSVYNRLLSIEHDAQYVQSFRKANPNTLLLANLRCGQWYSSEFDSTCYFKSTDGHCGYWKFNLRRFNPHIALKAAQHGRVAIVDSTRKGKRHPDAFTRTIPIWVAVVNRAVYRLRILKETGSIPPLEHIPAEWSTLIMPDWIPEAESRLVVKKVEEFCQLLLATESIQPTLLDLCSELKKPMKCFWMCPSSHPSDLQIPLPTEKFSWLILLCPSEEQDVIQQTHVWYIQGAADDEETWAQGLTAQMFWKHKEALLANADETSDLITALLQNKNSADMSSLAESSHDQDVATIIEQDITWIVPGKLAIGHAGGPCCSPSVFSVFDLVINCSGMEYPLITSVTTPPGKKYMHLVDPFEKGANIKFKVSRRLPATLEFVKRYYRLDPDSQTCHPLLIHGFNALDIATGLIIGVLAANFDDDGKTLLPVPRLRKSLTKPLVKHFLLHVAKYVPEQLPSVLVSDVNRYFLTTPTSEVAQQEAKLVLNVPHYD